MTTDNTGELHEVELVMDDGRIHIRLERQQANHFTLNVMLDGELTSVSLESDSDIRGKAH